MTSKIRKHRGRKTGWGSKKKHRGAGSRGGRGNAGLAKHKKGMTEGLTRAYFKKPSMKPLQHILKKRHEVINLGQINELALKKNLKEIELKGYKVLGTGSMSSKILIRADAFSKSAEEKIKKSGGKTEIIGGNLPTAEPKETLPGKAQKEEPTEPAEPAKEPKERKETKK